METKLRGFEREAATGDPQAVALLKRHNQRRGVGPTLQEEGIEATRQARIQRVLDYIFHEGGLGADYGFDCFSSIAGEAGEGPVIAGNWNDTTRWIPPHGPYHRRDDGSILCIAGGYLETTDTTPSRLERILERLDIETVWSDEYLSCDCGKGFRVQPDGHGWTMYGHIGDGDWCCGDCLELLRCTDCGELPTAENCTSLPTGYHHDGDGCHCGHKCEHDTQHEPDEA